MGYTLVEIEKAISNVERSARIAREIALESSCPDERLRFEQNFARKCIRLIELQKMADSQKSKIVFK